MFSDVPLHTPKRVLLTGNVLDLRLLVHIISSAICWQVLAVSHLNPNQVQSRLCLIMCIENPSVSLIA